MAPGQELRATSPNPLENAPLGVKFALATGGVLYGLRPNRKPERGVDGTGSPAVVGVVEDESRICPSRTVRFAR
ncbi:hypothetical protein NITHO_3590003 [Nitrolancea hollandica Lb]|uniref:Uncharacterized protein n=1 Tax=Nitrolancea hollandica Lb TaxID=1129897 RepID=I4EIQ0_9BACT|nr:hypothetical protein NITHO_3590003 [Nitrolancea hollandica Lb]